MVRHAWNNAAKWLILYFQHRSTTFVLWQTRTDIYGNILLASCSENHGRLTDIVANRSDDFQSILPKWVGHFSVDFQCSAPVPFSGFGCGNNFYACPLFNRHPEPDIALTDFRWKADLMGPFWDLYIKCLKPEPQTFRFISFFLPR